jgi:eukaryotic-like serine/threonine-protein kinase
MQQRYGEGELIAREALAVLEKLRPDHWFRFNAMSLVGGALLGRQEYTAAEPFLVRGYEGLKQREATIYRPQLGRLTEAGNRLARYYDSTNQPEKARAVREEISRLP